VPLAIQTAIPHLQDEWGREIFASGGCERGRPRRARYQSPDGVRALAWMMRSAGSQAFGHAARRSKGKSGLEPRRQGLVAHGVREHSPIVQTWARGEPDERHLV